MEGLPRGTLISEETASFTATYTISVAAEKTSRINNTATGGIASDTGQ